MPTSSPSLSHPRQRRSRCCLRDRRLRRPIPIYKRRLFRGQMRELVTSRSPSERRAAWELGLVGDDVIREIKLDATFDKVLQQALLSVDIVKIGLGAEGTAEAESYLQDADQLWLVAD